MDQSTKAGLQAGSQTARAEYYTQTEQSMMVTGKAVHHMGMAYSNYQTEGDIKDNGKRGSTLDKVSSRRRMEPSTMVSGWQVNTTAVVPLFGLTVHFIEANGAFVKKMVKVPSRVSTE